MSQAAVRRRRAARLVAGLLAWVLLGCAGDEDPGGVDLTRPVADTTGAAPTRLSAYNFFRWDPAVGFTFNERVVPYDLNTALFSDHALKQRAIYVPEGRAASYHPEQAFSFPVGSVLIKSFYFPADFRAPRESLRLIETRLLVRRQDGWDALPYIWDAAQRDAVLAPAGEVRAISFVDTHGAMQTASYLIPQKNQCEECHGRQESSFTAPVIVPIGIKARHLHRSYDYGGATPENQLARLIAHGMLSGVPALDTIVPTFDFRRVEASGVSALTPAERDAAARGYLDVNCAHCHDKSAVQGDTSQLWLSPDNHDLFHLGVCKRPGSAGAGNGGLTFGIVPGDPARSILYFRTHTTQVGAMMPLLGRSLRDELGAALLHAWIAAMPPDDCL